MSEEKGNLSSQTALLTGSHSLASLSIWLIHSILQETDSALSLKLLLRNKQNETKGTMMIPGFIGERSDADG